MGRYSGHNRGRTYTARPLMALKTAFMDVAHMMCIFSAAQITSQFPQKG